MPYKVTPGQREFLKRRAMKAKDEETCCDCAGGSSCPIPKDSDGKYEPCKGFVRNCTCDIDMESFRNRKR